MIRAVFFDLDNTLYSYDRCAAAADDALQEFCLSQFGIPKEETAREIPEMMQEIIREMGPEQAATHDRLIRFQRFLEKKQLPVFPYAGMMYELYWGTLLEAAEPEKGAHTLLRELKARGIFLACATNMTSRIQYKKIEKLGMGGLFDTLITSEEACSEKPFEKFFRFCVAKTGFDASSCAFVGDNFRLDVLGSEAAGLRGVHYQTPSLAALHTHTQPGYPRITDYRNLDESMRMILGDS